MLESFAEGFLQFLLAPILNKKKKTSNEQVCTNELIWFITGCMHLQNTRNSEKGQNPVVNAIQLNFFSGK